MKLKKTFPFLIMMASCDLIVRLLPQMRKQERFAFLVHPRSSYDAANKYPFFNLLPQKIVNFILKYLWPITASKIEGLKSKDNKPIRGWLIGVPLTPRQMTEDRNLARKRIIQAAELAVKKGAKIIGLGALNASFTRGGLDIVDYFSKKNIKAGITNGKSYTSWIVTRNVMEMIKIFGFDLKFVKIAVVGAAGSIGSACAHILLKEGVKNMLLIDTERKKDSLECLVNDFFNLSPEISIKISYKISDVKKSDIIIAATNAPEAKIKSEDLRSGSIVIDDAQPSDVDPEIIKTRNDVLVIEGGLIHAPGINPHINFGLKHKEDIYCCLGETMALAYADYDKNFSIGKLDFSSINTIINIAQELEFRLAEFQNFQKVISPEDIERVKCIKNALK